jgi:hypothetical protein
METLTWRHGLLKLPYVSRCWIEWNIQRQKLLETLVVEVVFDTDRKSARFNPSAFREIQERLCETDTTSELAKSIRVVPRAR